MNGPKVMLEWPQNVTIYITICVKSSGHRLENLSSCRQLQKIVDSCRQLQSVQTVTSSCLQNVSCRRHQHVLLQGHRQTHQ